MSGNGEGGKGGHACLVRNWRGRRKKLSVRVRGEGGRVKRSGAAVGGKDSSLLRPNMCGGRLNIRRCNEEGQRGNDSLLMNRDIEAPRR